MKLAVNKAQTETNGSKYHEILLPYHHSSEKISQTKDHIETWPGFLLDA